MSNPALLLVEDNQTEQYVLSTLLRGFDYDAVTVSSGEEAVDIFSTREFAAVLVDLTLPGMDGIECAKRLRKIEGKGGRRTPIIALTARSEDADRRACLSAGMDDFLTKPFEPEQLRKILLRWVYTPGHPNLKVLGSDGENQQK